MNKVIFDASAVIALLNQERGHEIVAQYLEKAVMSTVNLSEVLAVFIDTDTPKEVLQSSLQELIKEIIPFDEQQALVTASLRKITKAHGLSLGDRACLALASQLKLPVLTADKAWSKISLPLKIILIR
jgi:ribonuclease VapC